MKLSKLHLYVMFLLVFVSGCAEEQINKEQTPMQKTSASNDVKESEVVPDKQPATKENNMKKRDPNALDNRDPNADVRVTTVDPNTSKSLRDVLKEKGVAQKEDCEEQFKNEHGVCEVPNQPYPFPEKGEKPKE